VPDGSFPRSCSRFLPKCPLCIVAYASALGIGLSFSAATALQLALVVACVVALVVAIVRRVRAKAS
jgi:hypothetical protein